MIFRTNLARKVCFQFKTGLIIKFSIFELVWGPSFILNRQFWLFQPYLSKTGIPSPNRTNEHHYQIQHIWISLGCKFHLKQIIIVFWTKFSQKWWNNQSCLLKIKFGIKTTVNTLNSIVMFTFLFSVQNIKK